LSLPQNWAGSSDPGTRCPYCGKPIASKPGAPGPVAPPEPAPAPKAAAKTILWGVGVPIPGPFGNMPPAAPAPVASPRPAPFAPVQAPAPAPASARRATSDLSPALKPTEPAVPAALDPVAGSIDVDISEPPEPARPAAQIPSNKPNLPAPTVMYEPPARMDMSLSNLEHLASENDPVTRNAAPEEPAPAADSGPRQTPTRARFKSKPLARKGLKPRPGMASGKRADGDEDLDVPKRSSSKAGLIVFLVLLVCGAAVIGAVLLRGRGKGENKAQEDRAAAEKAKPTPPPPAPAEPAPSEEPPAPVPPPAAVAEKPPVQKPAHAEKPAPAEKPAHADKAAHTPKAPTEKPVTEKPARADKAKFEPAAAGPEPKAAGGKANEENIQRASEAYQRGNSKLFAGNTTEAIAEFSMALKLNPKDPASHRGLGLAYEKAGKPADAVKQLKLYLKASPKASDRATVEKRIEQLKAK
jgi:hypothetical protein